MTPVGLQIVEQIFTGVAAKAHPILNWRAHLGASSIGGECERAAWYDYRWHTRKQHIGRILRLFDRGHREEPALIADIRKSGVEVQEVNPSTNRQWSFRHPTIPAFGGSMDGITRGWFGSEKWIGLEIKTAAASKWKEFERHGVRITAPGYYAQVQSYMRLSHLAGSPCPPLSACLELVVNKNTDDLFAELIKYDPVMAEEIEAKAQRILDAPRATDLVRLSPTPDFWKCKFCDHKLCHNERIEPAKNCRSCRHVERTPHTWRCTLKNKRLPLWVARAGCDKYTPLERFAPHSEPG